MDNKNLILIIIGALFFLTLGGGLGILYQQQKEILPVKETPKTQAVQTLSSKVIPSITAFGQVSNIDGRNLTLTFGGDNLTIKINDSAQIYLPATKTSAQQTAQFSDIKKGDNVSVNVKLLSDGQMDGQMVVIIGPQK